MANTIEISAVQYDGLFSVSGDIVASGKYTIVSGNVLRSFNGTVENLGRFGATTNYNGELAYRLDPVSESVTDDLMAAALAIKELIEAKFPAPQDESEQE